MNSKRVRFIILFVFCFAFLFTAPVTAQNKVVVIPLMKNSLPPASIAAVASSGTISTGISVGSGAANYTALATKDVNIPIAGHVILMGEASWSNNGSTFIGCRFLENGSQVDFWWWEAGDDTFIDQHQTRFFMKTVTPGLKTYSLACYRNGGTSATAYYRNLIVQFIKEGL